MIFGLPVSLFALQMVSVVASLLVIIFSFGLVIILGAFAFNGLLYVALLRFASNPKTLLIARVFPQTITNKKASIADYEED